MDRDRKGVLNSAHLKCVKGLLNVNLWKVAGKVLVTGDFKGPGTSKALFLVRIIMHLRPLPMKSLRT